nr:TIGR02588 family protein [Rhizobium sp. Q54]
MTTSSKNRHTEAVKPHWVEWATGVVSAMIVLTMIAWIAGETLLQEDVPPSFSFTVSAVTPVENGHRVEFDILNRGTLTAAAVSVRAEITEQGQPVEDAEVTFDYVPGNSKASGGVVFTENPADRDIRLRAMGYTDP